MLNFAMAVAALKAINPITAATTTASVAAVVGGSGDIEPPAW